MFATDSECLWTLLDHHSDELADLQLAHTGQRYDDDDDDDVDD